MLGTYTIYVRFESMLHFYFPLHGCLTTGSTQDSLRPFVTAVGGPILFPEQAVALSGGGFSNYFARPLYQAAAV
ncbi:hypothetical protein C8R45DRAFT_1212284 [Mycena sanguinolenta]|nr:hypothetical protein C8R45DRAFT_1212266 [Mycena sanguinolenta]KAJ6494219.1 hypothetical protein C8R45DRAFT_1212284 [Mycena sanguinolenta]